MDSASMLKVVLDNTIDSLKAKDLCAFLKQGGCTQSGDKAVRIWRIKCFLDGEHLLVNEKNPATLKRGVLKKECAKRGLPPMGNADELLELLIDHLRREQPDKVVTTGAKPGGGESSNGSTDDADGLDVAKRIVEMKEQCNYTGILSVLGHNVTETSTTSQMRKAYLKVSLLVHPDKLKGQVATKAFQAVVYSFERLSKPELFEEAEAEKGKPKAKKISRSNTGCFRTKICCPRCRQQWGKPVDGVPKYAYNFFMQALRTYHCSTCLLDFGCMTALHQCPHCHKSFQYEPNDYHRKIRCDNAKCPIPFGFFMFYVSQGIEKAMRKEIKAEQVKRLKVEESKRKRMARMKRKHGDESQQDAREKRRQQVRLYKRGLIDACPLCGLETGEEGSEIEHLRSCRDKSKWKDHKKKVQAKKAKIEQKEKGKHTQNEAMNLAAWEFLGANTSSIWLLTHEQLKKQCNIEGLEQDGDKDELIARLAAHRAVKDSRLLTDGSSGRAQKFKSASFSRESLPDNLYSMSMSQIRSVCAAHGFLPKAETKDDMIEEIETKLSKDQQLLLK